MVFLLEYHTISFIEGLIDRVKVVDQRLLRKHMMSIPVDYQDDFFLKLLTQFLPGRHQNPIL